MMCGGTGEEKPADADVQGHCDAVKADVEKHVGKTFETFEAKSYKSQVSQKNWCFLFRITVMSCRINNFDRNRSGQLAPISTIAPLFM